MTGIFASIWDVHSGLFLLALQFLMHCQSRLLHTSMYKDINTKRDIKIHCMAQHSGEQFHQIKKDCTIKIDIGFMITPDRHVYIYVFVYTKVEISLMGNKSTYTQDLCKTTHS